MGFGVAQGWLQARLPNMEWPPMLLVSRAQPLHSMPRRMRFNIFTTSKSSILARPDSTPYPL